MNSLEINKIVKIVSVKDNRMMFSSGKVEKLTDKWVYLSQGVIRGQWIPREHIVQVL